MLELEKLVGKRDEPKKIKIVSPKAPSGVAWLINALICLGIRVSRESSPYPGTFVKGGDGFYRLHEAEASLKLHFPILTETEKFVFREDVLVEWTHDWTTEANSCDRLFIFVRDPRDALFSLYKRRNPVVPFNEFLRSLDFVTLLSQIDNWRLFIESWMSSGRVAVLRFEDFKECPELSLSRFLTQLDMTNYDPERIEYAGNSSSVEKAKIAENKYKEHEGTFFMSGAPLNRKGQPFEWKCQLRQYENEYKFISSSCVRELRAFQYDLLGEGEVSPVDRPDVLGLAFNQPMPEQVMSAWIARMSLDRKAEILKFYENFLASEENKYGFYESWERMLFERNMTQFIRLSVPALYFANTSLSPMAMTSLALNAMTVSNTYFGEK